MRPACAGWARPFKSYAYIELYTNIQFVPRCKQSSSSIGYWKLLEEALDRTLWRSRFGRGCGPVVRQTTEWMNEHDTLKWYSVNQNLYVGDTGENVIRLLEGVS